MTPPDVIVALEISVINGGLSDANDLRYARQIIDALRAAGYILGTAEMERDERRMDWIIDNATSTGGGNGSRFEFFVPHDTECLRAAIDAAMKDAQP